MNEQIRVAVLNTAIALAHHGIRSFPCVYGQKVPRLKGDWRAHASTDTNVLSNHFSVLSNIAIHLGPASGVCDVEPDDEASNRIVEDIMARSGVRTIAYASRRGNHRLFRWSPELDVFGKANVKAGKLELRLGTDSKGAYSVAPPSLHPDTQQQYQWLPGCSPWETPVAAMPEELKQYFLQNVPRGSTGGASVTEVDQTDDGYLPGVGHRHEFLLKTAKLLRCDLRLPTDVAMDMVRTLSQACGSYDEEKRGELELTNLFSRLKASPLPEDVFAKVDFSAAYDLAATAFNERYTQQAGGMPDFPSDVFCPEIETASQWAREAGLPRNLFLSTMLAAGAFSLGNAVTMQASLEHPTTGLQLYTLGVGKAGAGKSRVLKALLSPFANTEDVLTDATAEALTSALSRHTRGVLLEVAEGRELPNMLGRYSQGGSSPPVFHKAWSGELFRVQRQKGLTSIENPFLCIVGAIQPVHLGQFPPSDLLDGMLQRMLVFPVGRTPPEDSREAWSKLQGFLVKYRESIQRLKNLEPGIGKDSVATIMGQVLGQKPMPKACVLTPAAYMRWKNYAGHKKSDHYLSQWPDDHPFQSDVIRHAEIVLRLAATLFWLDWSFMPEAWYHYQVDAWRTVTIEEPYITRAISAMEFFWHSKQWIMDHHVEYAFAKVDPSRMLLKTESLPDKLSQYKSDRQRRIERKCGEEWTVRDYYRTLGMKRDVAENELALLLNTARIMQVPNTSPVKFRFVGDPEDVNDRSAQYPSR